MSGRYDINQPDNWTDTYASFKNDGADLGIQLTIIDGDGDFFVKQRDALAASPEKIDELNKKFEEIKKELSDNNLLSEETQKAYDELKKLMEEIDDPGLREALEKLRENMQQLSPEQLRKAMEDVIGSDKGTASWTRINGFSSAGKTGTAQNPHGEDHAWYMAYAPAKNPEIAFAVIVEKAGHGAEFAAPIARDFFMEYFGVGKPATLDAQTDEGGQRAQQSGTAQGDAR